VVVAALYGAGRAAGIPRLFWNQNPGRRFLAGLATTFLAVQCFVDAYLLDVNHRFPQLSGLRLFLALGALTWGVLIGARSLSLWLARLPRRQPSLRRAHSASLAPLVEEVGPNDASRQIGAYVHPGTFLCGAAVAMLITWGVLELIGRLELPPWLASFVGWLCQWRPIEEPRLHLLQAVIFLGLVAALVFLRR